MSYKLIYYIIMWFVLPFNLIKILFLYKLRYKVDIFTIIIYYNKFWYISSYFNI